MLPIHNDARSFSERQKRYNDDFDRRFNDLRLSGATRMSPNLMDSSFVNDQDGVRKYQIRVNAAEFEPQDITVRVDNGLLIVEANRKMSTPQGSFSEKKFRKTATIPQNVDLDSLVSTLSSDGMLTIEGPVNDPPEYQNRPEARFGSILKRDSPDLSAPKETSKANVFRPICDPGVIDILGTKFWRLKLNSDSLECSEIKITLNEKNSKLSLLGMHVQVSDGCKSTTEYNRDYTLPNNCDLECMQAYLESGNLIVEAKLQDEYQPNRELIEISRI